MYNFDVTKTSSFANLISCPGTPLQKKTSIPHISTLLDVKPRSRMFVDVSFLKISVTRSLTRFFIVIVKTTADAEIAFLLITMSS